MEYETNLKSNENLTQLNELRDQTNFEQQAIETECRLKENEKLKELVLTEDKNLSSQGASDNF